MFRQNEKSAQKQFDRFKKAHGQDAGFNFKNDEDAIKAAEEIYTEYKRNNWQPRTEVNKAAQRLIEGRKDKMAELPRNASEREYMRSVVYRTVEKLREMGYDVTPADLQATVWYPEKELHGAYGIGSGRSAPDDYAAAAARLLEERDGK